MNYLQDGRIVRENILYQGCCHGAKFKQLEFYKSKSFPVEDTQAPLDYVRSRLVIGALD